MSGKYVLVQLDLPPELLPDDYRLVTLDVPDDIPLETLEQPVERRRLPRGRRSLLDRGEALGLRVPARSWPRSTMS